MSTWEFSAGLFVRGLTNVKAQLVKAEAHASTNGIDEAILLHARIASQTSSDAIASAAPADLHMYTLAAQTHWATEGARLAMSRLLGASRTPSANDAKNFSDLYRRLDDAMMYLHSIKPSDLEGSLDREIVVQHRHGSVRSSGRQFLVGYAIPHFYYHVGAVYSILRNEGVPLTMGDYLGNWGLP